MAGAVGIVFGLCVLSFTLGAALMYVVLRRREDAGARSDAASERPVEQLWVEKAAVEPIADNYETRPIHRNPVVGLPQLEPALAALAEPALAEPALAEPSVEPALVAEPALAEPSVEPERAAEPEHAVAEPVVAEPVVAEPVVEAVSAVKSEPVVEAEPEPVSEVEPEPVAEVEEPETVGAARYDQDGDFEPPVGEVEAPESSVAADTDSLEAVEEPVVTAELPPPAAPQPVEHTTWVEREDFRARYLRTFEEVRRKAGSN